MIETQNDRGVISTGKTGTPPAQGQGQTVYEYASAGITEREGNVPAWLWIVIVSLLMWGVYYLVSYWNAPAAPM